MTIYNPECFTLQFHYPSQWEQIKEAKLLGLGIGVEFDSFNDFLMYCEDIEALKND